MGTNFIEANGLLEIDDTAKLITVSYFALTTLSTVGYGDYGPLTQTEMIVTVIIQLAGVAVFSFAMGMLTSMIESSYSSRDQQADLDYWQESTLRYSPTGMRIVPGSLHDACDDMLQ